MQARLGRMADVIRIGGLLQLPRHWIKPLGNKLWEMRFTGKDGIARAIYVTASGQRIVIVRIFVKKSEKTPRHEIELAQKRAREIQ
jgi:phage-related protein